jgi:hypothetical protein
MSCLSIHFILQKIKFLRKICFMEKKLKTFRFPKKKFFSNNLITYLLLVVVVVVY